MNKLILKQTCIEVHNYDLGDQIGLEKSLSIWNDTYFRYEPKGFDYDDENRILYLPRGMDIGYLERLFNRPIEIDRGYNDYRKSSYKLIAEPRDTNQVKSIAYLIGENDFSYAKRYSQQLLNLDTGIGKTYATIAASTFLQMTAIIITHQDTIKNQWMTSFEKFTNISEQFMYNIKGSKCIDKLMKMKDIKYKLFFVNHSTIKSWCKKNGWDKLNDVFKHLGIGLKIFDEAHLEFKSVLKIDFHTNVFKTFYLTATFERSRYEENRVFNLCFKNIAKFGTEVNDNTRKHVVYIAVKFNSKPKMADIINIKGRKGFDRNKYIDYQLKKGRIMDVIEYLLDYFNGQEGKTMILSSKISSSFYIKDYLEKYDPSKKYMAWNSQVSDEEKAEAYNKDVISGTPLSLGTGFDIPGLRFMIMTEPYSSKLTAKQVSGRLREYSPDMFTFYVEIVDTGFPKVVEMYKKRLKVFKEKCVAINVIDFEKIPR